MRTYEKYKDSGISWIGKIPEDWEVGRFKYSFKVRKGLTITKADLVDEGIPVISYGQVHSKENPGTHLKESLFRYVPNKYLYSDEDCLVCKGDFIFADTSEDIEGCGNCVYVDKNTELFAGYHSIIAKSIHSDDCKFFSYLFLTDRWRKQIRTRVSGVKVFSITQDYLKNTTLIIPPYSEQQAIANYLDKKTAEIDKIIAEREKKIELLNELKSSIISRAVTKGINPHAKMKDSGIDWIGEIPEDWEVRRLKFIVNLQSGSNLTSEKIKDEGKYPVYGGNGIRGFYSDYNLDGNYVLIGRQGALCGNINYSQGKIWATEHAVVCYPIKELNYRWLGSMLKVMNLNQYSTSAAQPGLAVEKIKNIEIAYPPFKEQNEISNYITKIERKINKYSNNTRKTISLLREYKQSLISEVVTGKRKVID